MSVYAIALLNITDRAGYGAYERGFMEIFARHGGRLLSVDENPTVKEGEWPWTRSVLIEFPSRQAFDGWFHSGDYQAIAEHRRAASAGHVVLLNGLPGAAG